MVTPELTLAAKAFLLANTENTGPDLLRIVSLLLYKGESIQGNASLSNRLPWKVSCQVHRS